MCEQQTEFMAHDLHVFWSLIHKGPNESLTLLLLFCYGFVHLQTISLISCHLFFTSHTGCASTLGRRKTTAEHKAKDPEQ